MDFEIYISDKALILIPVLYALGIFIKNTPKVPDWVIPHLLILFGVLGSVGLIGFSAAGVLQGILAAAAAVTGNQILKQTLGKD